MTSQSFDLCDLLNCMICLSEANNPHICPKCSKIVCYKCIEKWLKSGPSCSSNFCPNCKSTTFHAKNFVKLRWFDDIKKCIENNKAPLDDGNCKVHDKKLVMFCQNCKTVVCIDCVNGDHKLHKFQEFDEAYDKLLKEVEQKFSKLDEKAEKLKKLDTKIEENLANIEQVKKVEIEDYKTETEKKRFDLHLEFEWKLNQLNQDLKFKERDINIMYKDTVSELEKEKKKVEDELEDIRRIKRKFNTAKTHRKSLFSESDSLQNCCKEINGEEIDVPDRLWVVPKYTKTTEYLLERASSLSNIGVYSNTVKDYYDHSWRLYIKKNTNGTGVGVYIECTDGESSWQECRIQVVHHITNEIYQQKFYHFFDTDKKIWGFPCFLSTEDFEKYTNKDKDVMKFYYHIKPYKPVEIELE